MPKEEEIVAGTENLNGQLEKSNNQEQKNEEPDSAFSDEFKNLQSLLTGTSLTKEEKPEQKEKDENMEQKENKEGENN